MFKNVFYENILLFILLRCNDWVYEVRKSAINLLPKLLQYAIDDEIINSLPIIEKLRKSKRCDFKILCILTLIINIVMTLGR